MKLFQNVLFLFTVLVTLNANPLNREDVDEWTWVPTRSGIPIPLKLARAMSQAQLIFNVENDVVFELYTLKNKNEPQILKPNSFESIRRSNFNKSLPTRIYIHGWQEHFSWVKKSLNDAYLEQAKLDVNLIAVNWEKSSYTLHYPDAASYVGPIGVYVARLIDFMVENELASLKDIHVIGFSLGGHAAGYAGKNVKSGKLTKIIGLDPAGPLFKGQHPNLRLDKNDAKYVEIIHTSGTFLGIHQPIGAVNFYPNHGKGQSGCWFDFTGVCSHLRSYKYFAESIHSPVKFLARSCKTFEDMQNSNCEGYLAHMGGEPGNYQNEASVYYLETNGQSLFAKGWW